MKTSEYKIIATICALALCFGLSAANIAITDTTIQNTVIISSDASAATDSLSENKASSIEVNGSVIDINSENSDTVIIRIGGEVLRIPGKNSNEEKRKKRKERRCNSFVGHYSSVTFGKPMFTNSDYSMYSDPYDEFMDLNSKNSIQFGLNFAQEEIALNKRKSVGLVTGLGLSWNNYHFENDITLIKVDGMVSPIPLSQLDYHKIKKTKLTTLFLEVPLLLEIQFREKHKNDPFYLSFGGIGAVKLGSHTKIKHSGGKDKDHGSFYVNPFRYGATARVGYKSVYVYGNYYFSEFFESNKGPVLNQYTIGIAISAD